MGKGRTVIKKEEAGRLVGKKNHNANVNAQLRKDGEVNWNKEYRPKRGGQIFFARKKSFRDELGKGKKTVGRRGKK